MKRRRGATMVQWCLIAAAIGLAILATVKVLGTNTNTQMINIGGGVGDPSKLPAMNKGTSS